MPSESLPPPPRRGLSRSFDSARRPQVRVLTDDVWCSGLLDTVITDDEAAVWVDVTYVGADGVERSGRFPGYEVRGSSPA